MTTIMVTGVGAIIGYGVLRCLRSANPEIRRVGADIHADAVGQIWCDAFEQAPPTQDEAYLPWLTSIAEKHEVSLLIPGIEQDLYRLHDAAASGSFVACIVALNTPSLIELCRDKWRFYQDLLRSAPETAIPTYDAGGFEEMADKLGLPFLLKLRRSYASKGQIRVDDREIFERHASRLGAELIAQPILGRDDEEYTVAVFGDGNGRVCACITLRRRLAAEGATAKAWVSEPPGLRRTVEKLCAHYRPLGPTNLQFRHDEDCWKLLEINPRISSSTSIRAAFGYNEAAMCVGFYLRGELPGQPEIRQGFAHRYIEDHIVLADQNSSRTT